MGVQSKEEGPPESLVRKTEALVRKGRRGSDAPQSSLSCMSCEDPGRADFTPSLGMKRSLGDAREFPAHKGKGIWPTSLPCGPPYIDAAQVEPFLETQQHGAVTHQPVGTVGQRGKLLEGGPGLALPPTLGKP